MMELFIALDVLRELGHKELWISTNSPVGRILAGGPYSNMADWNNPTINRTDGTILAQRVALPDDWELVNGHQKIETRSGSLPNPVWITPEQIYEEIANIERIKEERDELIRHQKSQREPTDKRRL
ncbi:hypothetical protein E2566_11745 [Pectobacterium punjabense]|uniref:Uncharacterized protein n=1 Tax=Pectobacterium punjabense TaxID=2108399 RepID=A0ABX6L355_9GAMM|nr:hypothetical protein [Pectobacterium punjabense]MBS4431892.1 hypothetical protein [Pectobacterium punjabense]QJA20556.1 hypothetical protein E2566_11745 [Pectobacterium punjabense]